MSLLSDRVQRVKPSATLAISATANQLRREGADIISLSVGEPDFDTPDHIKAAAIAAIEAGKTKYTAVDGTPELKQAIIDKFKRDNGLDYAANQVLASTGGKQCIYNLCQALLNPGDEVIIPAPYWVSYPDMALLAEAEPVIVSAGQSQHFKLLPEQLEQAITPRTRLLFINSPSNPTGVCYSEAELQALGEVLRRHPEIIIATDDMYEHILFGGKPFSNIVMACPDLYDRTVVLNGVSKAYAMTGWRIGFCGGPAELIGAMKKVQSQSTSNPCSIAQAAATEALTGDQSCIETMMQAFEQRHAYVSQTLDAMDGVACLPSDGTFYSFPDASEAIARLDGVDDDIALADYLLKKAEVAVVPGSAFGLAGHFRVSYATSMENLETALARIADALGGK
ncbi:MAG TPA: pyridoxal phosphate-dependent aminotransferase [Gammaproteobacteria bacterium]|nr:pyridoxal phosphate-dependent aminotransferase [Gammaproteobacteria bacterium]